jgi:hypothetical protein
MVLITILLAVAARDAALRSLTKPTKIGFRQALLRATKDVAMHTASGIYTGQGMAYDVDLDRLSKVIERTTRGLYFHEFGCRLAEPINAKPR